jgi:hypothetical protein
MQSENLLTIDKLIAHPATMRILLALLEVEQAYQFQLTRMTGVHARSQQTAIKLLIDSKMVKIVQGKTRIRNVGEFYALTPQGMRVAIQLTELAKTLQNSK